MTEENDYGYDPSATGDDNEADAAVDFDVDDEYKPAPLIPNGNYFGSVSKVTFEGARLAFQVTLAENGDEFVLSDGETPLDGAQEYYNVWLPKAGDDKALTKSGRQTKRQWKINNMKKVGEKLGISLQNPAQIRQAALDGEWVGLDVIVSIGQREYNGEVQNEITDMAAREDV